VNGAPRKDPLRGALAVLAVLVAPFLLLFALKVGVVLALRALGLTRDTQLDGLPRVLGFLGAFAVGTSLTVPLVRRWSDSDLLTALVVASWYAGGAWVAFSGTNRGQALAPVALFTGVAVLGATWWGLRSARR
jgi:hypothetical protein